MNTLIKVAGALLLVLLVFSCSQEEVILSSEMDDLELRKNSRQKLNKDGRIWDCEFISNYQIYIDDCLDGTPYAEAILLAIAEYNAIDNTCLHMSITNYEPNAEVVLTCYDGGPCDFGFTNLPFNNQQRVIELNWPDPFDGCDCQNEMTVCNYAYVLLHELGHTIGFVHDENGTIIEDPDDPTSVVDNFILIDGTPERDPNSVFNGGESVILNGEANFTICDLPCELSEFDILAIQTVYPECKPQQIGYEVRFDPCLSMIYITAENSAVIDNYTWTFNFDGLVNDPHIGHSGKNNALTSLRVLYRAGEEFCFTIQAENCGGNVYMPCEVCYITPACEGEGFPIIGTPSNACSGGSCPPGYSCEEGICCEDAIDHGDMCVTDDHCPPGFKCINGDCCHKITGFCL